MKVTKQDDGTLFIDAPESISVSSALAEARSSGSPLSFTIDHNDAVKLALLIAVIPAPDTADPQVVVPRALLEELVDAAGWSLDSLTGSQARRYEEAIEQAKALLPPDETRDWLAVKGVEIGSGYSLDRLMQAQWNARAQRRTDITDEEWEQIKMHPAHRSSLRILRDELMQRAADGEFDD
jgi:hypothetical protein